MARLRLAQRPRRQQQAVADAALVEDDDLHVAVQAQVLQAVVGHQHVDVGMGRAQQACRIDAPARHRHWSGGAAMDQQRLVADIGGMAVRTEFDGARALSAVAARDDAGCPAVLSQSLHECDDGRRLAGAAGDQVADHEHRHRRVFGVSPAQRIGRALPCCQRAVQPGQRSQGLGFPARLGTPPQALQQRFQSPGPAHFSGRDRRRRFAPRRSAATARHAALRRAR